MKLFSEKVKPTFTSSNHNILTVENYEEVFFDVYEFEINGEKFIAEKESTFKDSPVVSIPVEVGNKKYNAKFILNKGPQEVLFNEKNIDSIIEDTSEEVVFSNILEDISEPEDETIVFEKKENILQEINEAKSSAIDHVKQVKEQESLRAKKEFKDREDRLAQAIEESRKVVLDEFLSLTESTKEELFDHNDKNATDLRSKLFEYVNETFDKHSSKLSTSIERDHTNSVKSLKNDIKTLAEEIYNSKASTIEVNLQDGFNTRVDEFNKVLDSKIDDLSNNILALEKANVDINDTLNKNTNKALSRVGSVKKDLEVSIKHLEEDVQAKFDTAEEKAKDYYDSKILTIEEALEEKDKDTREYILNIINENKNDLLDKFSNLKNNTTTTIVEQYGEKNVKIDPKKIQNEIQTNLTNTFSQQLLSLRKAVDMYSGGGSVAKQFANGGTMEGNLTVTGEITADKIFATTLLSASEVNYEFELSGFSVTGDISANGDLTVNQLSAIGSGNNYIAGNVGIGTTSPNALLHVKSTGNGEIEVERNSGALVNIQAQAARGVFGTDTNHELHLKTNAGTRMTLSTGGNVGIGTTSPGRTLHVNSAGANVAANFESTDSGAYLSFSDNSTTNDSYVRLGALGDDFQFFAGGAERVRMDSAGRVGIGTTTIPHTLSVKGTISRLNSTGIQIANIGSNGEHGQLTINNSGGTNRVTLNSSGDDSYISVGNVGIGTTSPSEKLTVDGNIRINGDNRELYFSGNQAKFRTSSASSDVIFETGTTELLRLDASASSVNIPDVISLKFGSGGDLAISHDGNNSIIAENGAGDLYLQSNNASIYLRDTNSGRVMLAAKGGSGEKVELYYEGSKKFETASGGATITGNLVMGGGQIKFADDGKVRLGDGNDLNLYHNGTDSVIENVTGDLKIQNYADDKDIIFQCDDGAGGTETYFRLDGSASSGDPVTEFPDNSKLSLGTSQHGITLYHDGTDSFITNAIGDLTITNFNNDKDIIFKSDDGSGGTTTYFKLDGSHGGNPITNFPDSSFATFGSSNDLQIYHNGFNSNIDNYTGGLYITQRTDDGDLFLRCDDGSGGITSYIVLDGSDVITRVYKNFTFSDDVAARFGTSNDLVISHDGTDSKIRNTGGDLIIQQEVDDKDIIFKSDDGSGGVTAYLTLDGSAEYTLASKDIRFGDSVNAQFGNSGDLAIFHDGSNSLIYNANGALNITQSADDSDIIFECDNGSGGLATYILLDGSDVITRVYKNFRAQDNVKIQIGSGADAYLKHDGTDTSFQNDNGNLYISNTADDKDIIFQCDDGAGGGAEYFRLDGSFNTAGNPFTIFPDNSRIAAGNAADLSIFHNGTNSNIENITGNLIFTNYADDADIIFKSDDGAGGVETYFFLDGSVSAGDPYTVFPDNSNLAIGSNYDLRIKHNGTDTNILNTNGHLYLINSADDKDIIFQSDDGSGGVTNYFYLDGGNTLTYFAKPTKHGDSILAGYGTDNDLVIYHNGTDSVIDNFTGDLYISNKADDKDIIFQSDDGSGGVATYFSLDGSVADGTNLYTVFPDSSRIRFGTDLDLDIHHDGSNSYISQTGTGNLNIQQTVDDGDLIFKSDNGSGGTTQYFRLDGGLGYSVASKAIRFDDNVPAYFGSSNDLQIYHDGSNSYIQDDSGTGDLIVNTNAFRLKTANNAESMITAFEDGAVNIMHNDITRLSTTSSGVHVIGNLVQTPGSSVTPASNGDLVVEATNNTTLTFKLKGSDGTVRSGTLTLS